MVASRCSRCTYVGIVVSCVVECLGTILVLEES